MMRIAGATWVLLILILTACVSVMAPLDQNKQIIRSWIEQLDARNIGVYDELLAQDAVVHLAGVTQTREEAIISEEAWYTAFPDTRRTIDELLAEGNRVILHETVRGTHRSSFQGIAATGREITLKAKLTYQIRDGQITEIWIDADLAGFVE